MNIYEILASEINDIKDDTCKEYIVNEMANDIRTYIRLKQEEYNRINEEFYQYHKKQNIYV